MKKIKNSTFLLLSVSALLLLSPLAFFACSTANLAAYKASQTAQVTVETAMTAWGDWIKHQDSAGTPVPMEQRAKVKGLYEKYQAAATVVADAGVGYTQAKGSTNETSAQAVLNVAMSVASQCLADIVDAIRLFGVKV